MLAIDGMLLRALRHAVLAVCAWWLKAGLRPKVYCNALLAVAAPRAQQQCEHSCVLHGSACARVPPPSPLPQVMLTRWMGSAPPR